MALNYWPITASWEGPQPNIASCIDWRMKSCVLLPEMKETKGGNYKLFKEWKVQYGADVVEG
ncbi:hypothetical protein D3C78_1666330 [compost metagenome]